MKRKKFKISLILSLALVLLIGCSYIQPQDSDVVLGDIKQLSCEVPVITVSQEEYYNELEYQLLQYSYTVDILDRGIENEDIVYIDYEMTLEGQTLEGDTDIELEIGSNSFIPGFEEGLIGVKTGNTKKLILTFPADYEFEEYRGKESEFNIKVNKITELRLPELTDEFVQANFKCNSVSEYEEQLREEIIELKTQGKELELKDILLKDLVSISTFPEDLDSTIDKERDNLYNSYNDYAEICGITIEELLKSYEMDISDLEANAKNIVLERAVINEILVTENIEPSRAERKALEEAYIEEYGYDTIKSFTDDNGEDYLHDEINRIVATDYIYKTVTDNK